jgi:hypothetical protein
MKGNLIADLMLNSGIAQYPDTKLYEAATLLTPEERPVAPVKVNKRRLGVQNELEGQYNPATHQIEIGRHGQAYKNSTRLAAALAHEAVHSKGITDEPTAYTAQHRVAKRLGEKDEAFLRVLLDRGAGKPIAMEAPRTDRK